jgi:hypothetical protein
MSDVPPTPVDPVVIPGQDPPGVESPPEIPQSPPEPGTGPDTAPPEIPDAPLGQSGRPQAALDNEP